MNPHHPDELETTYAAHLDHVARRTSRALATAKYDSLLVHSGTAPLWLFDDQTYPFKANAPFKLWAPITDVPDCFVHFTPGHKPVLLFHQPTDYWHKPAALPHAYWTKHFELHAVADHAAARALLPQDLSRTAYLGESLPAFSAWGLGATNPQPLVSMLDYERAVKTDYELACLRQANRRGALGHLAAAHAFRAGATEFEIELAFLKACGQREQELPYNPIIALNNGAAVLHYQMLERTVPTHRYSMLIDAGADYAGYPSDITRTYAYGNSDFAVLVGELNELQQSLCESVRAGVDWRDVHLSAHQLLAELLKNADVITCDSDEAVDKGVSSVFLPHGLGHLIGLQVHDVGGWQRAPEGGEIPRPDGHPYLRLTRVLQEGFVVTMEPGLYFIDSLLEQARADRRGAHINWTRVDQFRPYGGVRIEDNLAITATGCENLTRDAFVAMAGSDS